MFQMAAYRSDIPPPPGTITFQPGYEFNQMRDMSGSYMAPDAMITCKPNMNPGRIAMWMPVPPPMEGVPQGLEYLTMVDKIVVHQLFEVLELVTEFETKNKYVLKNGNGEQVCYAFEESNYCERLCCGSQRGFTIHIVDNFKREVMRIQRPFMCCGGGCYGLFANLSGCASSCTIEAPPGNLIGTVQQRGAFCANLFNLKDANDAVILDINGPCCCLLLGCDDKEFPVNTPSGETIGSITKKWSGCIWETFTDADVFCVTFPKDLDVKAKAILLGATFLIDYMEFENNNKKPN